MKKGEINWRYELNRYPYIIRKGLMQSTEEMLEFVNRIWNIAYYGEKVDTLEQALEMMDRRYKSYIAYCREVACQVKEKAVQGS